MMEEEKEGFKEIYACLKIVAETKRKRLTQFTTSYQNWDIQNCITSPSPRKYGMSKRKYCMHKRLASVQSPPTAGEAVLH